VNETRAVDKDKREFKQEAVRLVVSGCGSIPQAARDLDVHENVLRKWVRLQRQDGPEAFPGQGQMKAADAEIARLRKEVAKLPSDARMIIGKADFLHLLVFSIQCIYRYCRSRP